MFDENLPTFYLATSKDNLAHHSAFYLSRGGSEPEPAYSLHHLDPTAPTSKNVYGIALFDPYNPDILFGEVQVRPEWTYPTLSQDEIRRNNGVTPPPEPIIPNDFTIQLYNPDQQIHVTHRTSSFGSPKWEFSMPQQSFRLPSTSQLDRTQNDPAADALTPKVNFVWKRESKLSKEITCYLSGKSTDIVSKKKSKEPDITIALFKSLKELTIYEPNLYRVDMEDPKGLEITLLLGTVAIRDIWFGNAKTIFNLSESGRRRSSAAANARPQLLANPDRRTPPTVPVGAVMMHGAAQSASHTPLARPSAQPPPADPRTQWEIDAETARLKAQLEAEERELRRQEERRRQERERRDEEETKRLRKMVEDEEKERRKREKAAEKEGAKLRKLYGYSSPQSNSAPPQQSPYPRPHSTSGHVSGSYPQYPQPYAPPQQPSYPPNNGSYPVPSDAQGSAGHSGLFSSSNGRHARSGDGSKLTKKKSSLW